MTMFNRNQYNIKTTYCYNLKDIGGEPMSYADLCEYMGITTSAYLNVTVTSAQADIIDLLNALFKYYISNKYYDYTWITSTEELDFTFSGDEWVSYQAEAVLKFRRKLFNYINSTADRYYAAITNLGTDITKLMTGITVSSTGDVKALENDTPQSSEGTGLWNDSWASRTAHNQTTAGTETDAAYLDRINKLKNEYVTLMDEWANEFEEYLDGIQI